MNCVAVVEAVVACALIAYVNYARSQTGHSAEARARAANSLSLYLYVRAAILLHARTYKFSIVDGGGGGGMALITNYARCQRADVDCANNIAGRSGETSAPVGRALCGARALEFAWSNKENARAARKLTPLACSLASLAALTQLH